MFFSKKKILAVFLLISFLSLSVGPSIPVVSSSADAAVPVFRTDNFLEKLIHFAQELFNNYVKQVLTNIRGILSLESLGDLKGIIGEFEKLLDLKDQILDLAKGEILSEVQNIIGQIGDINLNSILNLGKIGDLDFGDLGLNLGDLIKTGDLSKAGDLAVDRITAVLREMISGTGGSGDGAKPDWSKKPIEGEGNEASGAKSAQQALQFVADTVPLSVPGTLKANALIAVENAPNNIERDMYAYSVADASKKRIMEQVATILVPYIAENEEGEETPDNSYKKFFEELREESKKATEDAAQFQDGGPSEALRAMAGLSATMVKQMALQNEALASLADMLADDIKINAVNALVNMERYSDGVASGITNWLEIWQRSGVRITK